MRLPNLAFLCLGDSTSGKARREPRAEWMSIYHVLSRGDGGNLPRDPMPPDDDDDDDALVDLPGDRGRFSGVLPASDSDDDDEEGADAAVGEQHHAKAEEDSGSEEVLDEGHLSAPTGPSTPPGRPPASAAADAAAALAALAPTPAQPAPPASAPPALALDKMSRKDRLALARRFVMPRSFAPWQGPWLMRGFTSTQPRLYVAQTQLRRGKKGTGKRLEQYGVFCHTAIEPGQFICAFSGTFMPKEQFDRKSGVHKAMRRHAVQLDFHKIGDKQEESRMLFIVADQSPSFTTNHVAQCLNEPPEDDRANAIMFQHQYVKDAQKGEFYSAVLVYAAYPIPAHTEIYLHYGEGYAEERLRNNYVAGDPAVWDETLVRRPSMDEVVEAILANGERVDEFLYKEGQGDEQEVVSSEGSKRRGNKQVDRFGF
jgi:hypothetical protein